MLPKPTPPEPEPEPESAPESAPTPAPVPANKPVKRVQEVTAVAACMKGMVRPPLAFSSVLCLKGLPALCRGLQMAPVVQECDLRVHSVLKSQHDLSTQIEHLNCGAVPRARHARAMARCSSLCVAARIGAVYDCLRGADRSVRLRSVPWPPAFA
jgi:hypothetical protein